MGIDKSILEQYCEMKAEAEDLRRRITEGNKCLEKMQEKGYQVIDSVKGTRKDGTIGTIKVTGFPLPEYERVQQMTRRRIEKLKILEDDLFEAMDRVEEYINTMPRSELRIMFRFYYLDDMSWIQVAKKMNQIFPGRRVKYTDENCRKRHDRFLEKNL